MSMDHDHAASLIAERWSDDIISQLGDHITIPALSPAFDAGWEATGHLRAAVEQVRAWIADRPVEGLQVEVHELEGRTPVIVAEVAPFGPAAVEGTVVLYGHVDKQPGMVGWRDGLGPWTPVRDGDRLYGRGGADDGYAGYAAVTAIEAVQRSGGSHGRLLVLIEASEESGSPDLPAHLARLRDRLVPVDGSGTGPDLVICLDSGCATYDTLWLTTSLRGLVDGTLTVEILTEGVHSGVASGIVPSSFRILRRLLDRVEDPATGQVLLESARVEVPQHRVSEAEAMAAVLGDGAGTGFPFVDGAGPVPEPGADALLARTWRSALSLIGADGIPSVADAGNVLRPATTVKLSFRIPPTADPIEVAAELRARLEADPPYGASVRLAAGDGAAGWDAPDLAPWLREALDGASQQVFGRPMQLMGEGGSIPFVGMLGAEFPDAQFVITGVLGPGSNAHGPNEFLDVAYAERLTTVVASVLDAHATDRTIGGGSTSIG
jgi:acetylornithine deacetylase/succinyl-diaminopimelate desuccinylase-like protein